MYQSIKKTLSKHPDIDSALVNDTPHTKQLMKQARKLAFSKFVNGHHASSDSMQLCWRCCSSDFTVIKDFHLHVAKSHMCDIIADAVDILRNGSHDARWPSLQAPKKQKLQECDQAELLLPCQLTAGDQFPWLPLMPEGSDEEEILLFYRYRRIHNTAHVLNWQKELCRRLNLTGKIRIATEGINATVGGDKLSTEMYIKAVRNHPLFNDMTKWDFKHSSGKASDFPDGLTIGVYQEIVPMGKSPQLVPFEKACGHLTVDEFHAAISKHQTQSGNTNNLIIDCRNFYESKIGQFEGAVCPDLRKFSYWPEYVDKNKALFENRDVYMYCTGGIRCERGSAYLIDKGICKNVYQLHGGIHKYIEKYPDGYFRGKLFVFDDRYHIKANEDILSSCSYCKCSWDQYEPCTSSHCHQLVLSCIDCRQTGLTACCRTCQAQGNTQMGGTLGDQDTHIDGMNHMDKQREGKKEECECTKNRVRIPVESTLSG